MTAEAARPSIPVERYGERLARARAGLARRDDACLLVGVGSDLVYLTGYAAMPLERLTMLVLPRSGPAHLVAPRLEAMAAAGSPAAAAGYLDRLWAMHLLALQRALPGRAFGLATDVLRDLRMTKDTEEIALLRLAAHAADRVVAQIAGGRLVGRTEADVSREVRERLLAEGHEHAEFAIVASGPNSASPHHDASERVIRAGEPIVLDIGGTLGGYGSDITRTLWVGGGSAGSGPTAEFLRIFDLVREAQARATDAVRPGVSCESLDAVARDVITEGGHGPDFFHRLGHGIGLEGHEDPYLVAGDTTALVPGMAFSIEPGVYLPDRYGVRIEDIVVCGPDGPVVLNEAARDLWLVDG
jgi:Xaa-Pro aminopeptidase